MLRRVDSRPQGACSKLDVEERRLSREGFYLNCQENMLQKSQKKHLEVLKNELDKMAIKLHHENGHRCDQAKTYFGELLLTAFLFD